MLNRFSSNESHIATFSRFFGGFMLQLVPPALPRLHLDPASSLTRTLNIALHYWPPLFANELSRRGKGGGGGLLWMVMSRDVIFKGPAAAGSSSVASHFSLSLEHGETLEHTHTHTHTHTYARTWANTKERKSGAI